MTEHPEEMPDNDKPTQDWVDDQSWWMDHPELAVIDDEIEEARFPDWALDVLESYDFQADYPSPVVPLWRFDAISQYPIDILNQRVESRKDRLERLRELNAPRVIVNNEQKLVCEAAAQYYWALARRYSEAKPE